MKLDTCGACARHLKAEEATCPFCGAERKSARHAGVRLVAAVVTAATLTAAACKEEPAPLPAYGIPPIDLDAGFPDGGVSDAGS